MKIRNILLFTVFSISSVWGVEILDVQNLNIGSAYIVSKQTPLMPEVDPIDVWSAIEKIKKIPAGGAFKITGIKKQNGTPWYKVVAIDGKNNPIGIGYINSIALLGQDLKEFKK